jgi:hypothetical protein
MDSKLSDKILDKIDDITEESTRDKTQHCGLSWLTSDCVECEACIQYTKI